VLRPTTLPTVTVTPTDTGRGMRYVGKCPGLPAFIAVGYSDHWHLSQSAVIYESLFALIDDQMAAHGVDEYQLDARAVVGAA
jgi:hypothetical protein